MAKRNSQKLRKGSYRQFHTVHESRPPADIVTQAWVAGFADAESCLSYRNGTPIVAVSNCHLPTLYQLAEWFGGALRPLRPGREAVRPCFQWTICGNQAREFLAMIAPLLREKKAQADLILAEPRRKRGQDLSEEDWARRAELTRRLAELKRVRFSVPKT